jgi:adenylate cyclase
MKTKRFIGQILLIHLFIVFFSNIVAVSLVSPLTDLVNNPDNLELDRFIENETSAGVFSRWVPFPVIIVLVFYIMWPSFKLLLSKKESILSKKILIRIINSPIIYGTITIFGWLLGSFLYFAITLGVYNVDINTQYLVDTLASTSIISGIVFVVNFYLVELYNRKRVLPKIDQIYPFLEWKEVFKVKLSTRMIIFFLSISLLPLFVTYQMLMIFNHKGDNIFNQDLSLSINILFLVIIFAVVLITILKTRAIVEPINRLLEATQSIGNGKFDTQLHITSTDEFGNLTKSMNDMAQGLQERETIKETFGKVVAPEIRDAMIKEPIELGGEERTVAVLFLDISGFTSISERQAPSETLNWLNQIFEVTNQAIHKNKGIINKYIGDSIMAIFGAPLRIKNPGDSALKSFMAIKEGLIRLNQEFLKTKKPQVEYRCGIHLGPVLAGNLGSKDRMEYTVIGDVVNTASRLEQLCKDQNTQVLFSKEIADSSSVEIQRKGSVKLKGKEQEVEIFTLR